MIIRRIRGLVGVSLITGAIGILAGTLLGVGLVVLDPRNYGWSNVVVSMAALGILGLLTGVGFAMLLTSTSRRMALSELSRSRVALFGTLAGILPTLLLFAEGVPSYMSLMEVLKPVLLGAGFGGLTGFGIVELARRGQVEAGRLEPGRDSRAARLPGADGPCTD